MNAAKRECVPSPAGAWGGVLPGLQAVALLLLLGACAGTPPLPDPPDLSESRFREQIQAADEAARNAPEDAEAVGRLAMTYQAYDFHGAAAAAFRRAAALDPEDWRWHFGVGLAELGRGRIDPAQKAYTAALEADPENPNVLVGLAGLAADRGETGTVERLYRQVLDIDAYRVEALLGLGRALAASGRCQEALEPLTRADRMAPQYGAVHDQLAACHAELGDKQAAAVERALFRRYGEIEPPSANPFVAEIASLNRDPTLRVDKARILTEAGAFAEAAALLAEATAADPTHLEAWRLTIQVAARRSMWGDAHEAYQKALEIDADSAVARYHYAIALARSGQHQPALDLLDEALRLDPDLLEAQIERGKELEEIKKLDEALEAFRAVIEADPKHRNALFYAGRNRLKAGDPDAAIPYLEQTKTPIDDQTPRMLRALAGAYSQAGRRSEAREAAEQAQDLAVEYGDFATAEAVRSEAAGR